MTTSVIARRRRSGRGLRRSVADDTPTLGLIFVQRIGANTQPVLNRAIFATVMQGSTSLPARMDRFVGRIRETAAVEEAVARSRLTLVTGPGGIGKTRLALEIARRRSHRGLPVLFIDLGVIARTDEVPTVVASALGLTQTGPDPTADVVRVLADTGGLLVVDTCEHVAAGAAAMIGALLQGCPKLRVLATSRQRLGVSGARIVTLGPLTLDEAVALFVERAQAVRPDAVLDTGPELRRLCTTLDRLPLALELAAARVAALTPATILSRVDHRLDLLSDRTRGGPDRHRSLRATMEWSFGLLTPNEQAGFARLAIFPAPFSLQAAESVADVEVDMLGALINQSLVHVLVQRDGELRYRILDTLRAFAREHLDELGIGEHELQGRHLRFLTSLAEAAYESGTPVGAETYLRAIADEIDNMRAVLDWSVQHDAHTGLRLIGATREVWFRHAQSAGLNWAVRLLDLCPEPDPVRARALLAAGVLTMAHQNHPTARRWLLDAIEVAELTGDTALQAATHLYLGTDSMLAGQLDTAEHHLHRSIALFDQLGQDQGLGRAAGVLGVVRLQQGAKEAARDLFDEELAALEAFDDPWGRAHAHTYLGMLARAQGDITTATNHLTQAATILTPTGDTTISGVALAALAATLADRQPQLACRFAGAAAGRKERAGGGYPPWTLRDLDTVRNTATARLGTDQAHAHFEAGRHLTPHDLMGLLTKPTRHTPRGPLTPRQADVTELVAQGLTNAQIAHRLHLSERTIENHIYRALTRLGLHSRVQLATWTISGSSGSDSAAEPAGR
jgi:predicted ATPase/DNA-binding CsgD family transcriptional regulator